MNTEVAESISDKVHKGLPFPRTAAEYVMRITACCQRSVESILEVGRLLIRAKANLPHGAFEAMVKSDLPFGPRSARMLMAIASDPRITNRKFVSYLPSSWGTLYEITRLDDASLDARFADGTICPEMERRDIATALKAERRAAREAHLGQMQAAANLTLPAKRYGFIFADPAWRFKPYSRATGMDRAADNHYPTSPTEEIEALPVKDIAAASCVLFLCATAPMLPDAMRVLAGWGFTYRTNLIWFKERPGNARGPGYWFTNEHETVLVGTQGEVPAPAPGDNWPSVLQAPVGRHSEKPGIIYDLIEAYFPNLPKIELNARSARIGWDRWGLDAPPVEAQWPPHDPATGEILELSTSTVEAVA